MGCIIERRRVDDIVHHSVRSCWFLRIARALSQPSPGDGETPYSAAAVSLIYYLAFLLLFLLLLQPNNTKTIGKKKRRRWALDSSSRGKTKRGTTRPIQLAHQV